MVTTLKHRPPIASPSNSRHSKKTKPSTTTTKPTPNRINCDRVRSSGANQVLHSRGERRSTRLQHSPRKLVHRLPTAPHRQRDTRSTSNQTLSQRPLAKRLFSTKPPCRSFPATHPHHCATTGLSFHARSS